MSDITELYYLLDLIAWEQAEARQEWERWIEGGSQ